MSTASEVPELGEVRRAAFDLRQSDPSEAVRVLRRLVRQGGDIEPLAHGALGEILLEDFDDIDGALHHFRRLLTLAPGVAAGELGLARALARNEEREEAQEAYVRALAGFESLASTARTAAGEDQAAGADEAVLTALELAVEEHLLCRPGDEPRTHPSTELLDWAESARLFDDTEEPEDKEDWARFAELRAELSALEGDKEAALAHVERIGRLTPLSTELQARIRSLVLETLKDLPRAADEALRALGPTDAPLVPEEWFRAAALLAEVGRAGESRQLLERMRARLNGPDDGLMDTEVRKELLGTVGQHLQELAAGGLVSLGRRTK